MPILKATMCAWKGDKDRMDFNEAFEHIAADRGVSADVLRAQVDAAIHEEFLRDDTEVKKWFHDRFGDREPTLEELVEAIAMQVEEI